MSKRAPLLVPDDGTDLTVKAWRVLEQEMQELGTPLLEPVLPILDFRKLVEKRLTTARERLAIIEQAELLLNHLYPHLPFKREVFDFIPKDLFAGARGAVHGSELQFHRAMLDTFAVVRDAHTTYGLPAPFSGAMAFLPFQVMTIENPVNHRHFVVASVMSSTLAKKGKWNEGFGHEFFGPGAIIVRWNGRPMDEHCALVANDVAGGNADAFFRRGAVACTTRILEFVPFPPEDDMPVAEIVYRPPQPGIGGGPEHSIRIPWGVARFPASPEIPQKSFSMSIVNSELNSATERLHYRDALREERRFQDSDNERAVSRFPDVFQFQFTGGPRRKHPIDLSVLFDRFNPSSRLGYLRIKTFRGLTENLVTEARRLLTLLDKEAPDGLVIDIRGNTGGNIEGAESILQMLTPHPIAPLTFHLARTDAMIGALRSIRELLDSKSRKKQTGKNAAKLQAAKTELEGWLADADLPPLPASSGRLTAGRPITDPDGANRIGQVYAGPVVLLVDAGTYSAADMFAAGFQDHGIGPIISHDSATGGGGANFANHSDIVDFLGPDPGIPVRSLPKNVFMRVAFRRCVRVGFNAGKPIEDFGVAIDKPYVPNIVDDVIEGMPAMITAAAEFIGRKMTTFRVNVQSFRVRANGDIFVELAVAPANTALRFFLDDDQHQPKTDVEQDETGLIRAVVHPPEGSNPERLRVESWSDKGLPAGSAAVLRCARRIELGPAPVLKPDVESADDSKRQRARNARARASRASLRRRR